MKQKALIFDGSVTCSSVILLDSVANIDKSVIHKYF